MARDELIGLSIKLALAKHKGRTRAPPPAQRTELPYTERKKNKRLVLCDIDTQRRQTSELM